ncbi:hypothetical protein [Cloacibacterium normanense]|uniref:hypothetical protein n=1 Tax=Cloacibacterium normanense TaxID=237258 RepID=UPI00391AE9D5
MSKNTSKQTLFRFVSLRNPQLTETKEKNLGFIFRPEEIEGHFDMAIQTTTNSKKMVVLQNATTNFEVDSRFKSEKNIETSDFAELLKIGRKISKNQTLSSEELEAVENYYVGTSNFGKQIPSNVMADLSTLWDHLIYQTVTQKDFYVKEAIIQIIKAIHVGYILTLDQDQELIEINGENFIEKANVAKVVLPSYLFIDGANKDGENQSTSVSKILTVNESNISNAYIAIDPFANKLSSAANRKLSNLAKKTQETSVASIAKSRLQNLKNELGKVQNFYKNEYNEAFKIAKEQNDLANETVLKNYKVQRLQIEANFNDGMNEASKALAIENLEKPDLVEFNFIFRNEINAQDFQNKLSKEGLRTLVQLIGIVPSFSTYAVSSDENNSNLNSVTLDNGISAILQLDDYKTYSDIYSLIDDKINKYDEVIYSNTSVVSESVVSLGGAVLSQKKSDSIADGSYVITPKSQNLDISVGSIYSFYQDPLSYYDFDLIIDTSEIIDSLEVNLKTNDELTYNEYPTEYSQSGNLTTVRNLFLNSLDYETFSKINQLTATIYFKSGKVATIDLIQSFEVSKSYTGMLNFDNGSNNADDTPVDNQEYRFSAKTVRNNPSDPNFNLWFIQFNFEDPSVDISSIDYYAKGINGDIKDQYLFKVGNGEYRLFNNQTFLSPDIVSPYGFIVEGKAVLSDGKTYSFSITMIRNTSENVDIDAPEKQYFGDASFTLFTSSGGDTNSGDGTENSQMNSESFIPKGFGIKRLGIADYLKVEQSLHAYVPGEVSHIENIMAREYKEKSTRRLRRQENTTTSSTDTEREKLTDTTSASRFEMQSEISKMLQESTDIGLDSTVSFGDVDKYSVNIGANFAHHQAKEESQRQALTLSQEITTRALERIVAKVHEERIEKIIEEFEENNKHGFDNTKGDKHVVGVYRWLDKRMKNQIFNYGKRMMFEFMIPEPAKLHTLAIDNLKKSNTKVITIPVDPRTSKEFNMKDYTTLSDDKILNYWMSKYNVEIDTPLEKSKVLSFSFSDKMIGQDYDEVFGRWTGVYNKDLEIPENYLAKNVKGNINVGEGAGDAQMRVHTDLYICGVPIYANINDKTKFIVNQELLDIEKNITISGKFWDIRAISGTLNVTCELNTTAKLAWQQKAFNAIVEAYEDAMSVYNSQLDQEESKAKQISSENPNYYRQIEQEILKHNAIAFLTDDEPNKHEILGVDLNKESKSMANYLVKRDNLDQYAALVKFMEQAFEWNIMSYNFYPYYWAGRADWETMHLSDSVDPLFRSFLQSGMARVIVTVKPGFEDAVNFYFTTGKIWSGGEVPVIGDPMYLSIVDELRETPGEPEGKFWITQIPTSLNMLQEKSIGLVVDTALPLHEEDPNNCENPEMLVKKEDLDFLITNDQLGQTSNKVIQLSWENMDHGYATIGYLDFPRVYNCLDHEILIHRDASWQNEDSVTKIYEILADKLSLIDGVYAEAMEEKYRGITLKVDITKNNSFELVKPGGSDSFDTFKFVTNAVDYISFPSQDMDYTIQRISDKNGINLTGEEVGKKLNLDRFLV